MAELFTRQIFGLLFFCLSVIFSLSASVSFADPIFRINTGATQEIDKHGTCLKIANASGKDLMVPTGTSPEWLSFVNNAVIAGVTKSACSIPMIMTWKTDNLSAGSTIATQAKLPLVSGATYNFVVDWGDGNTGVVTSDTDTDVA